MRTGRVLALGIALLVSACSSTPTSTDANLPEAAEETELVPSPEPVPATRRDPTQFSIGLVSVSPGMTIDVGTEYLHLFRIHCGMRYIEDLNGTNWKTDRPLYTGRGGWPDGFRQFFSDPNESVSPVLRTHITLISNDELHLTLPDGTYESTYHPTDEDVPPCA